MWLAYTEVPAPPPVDSLLLAVTEAGVALITFGSGPGARRQVDESARRLGLYPERESSPDRTSAAHAELADYLVGKRRTFDAPIDWRLSNGDQLTVLRTLYDTVAYGKTTTYGELAERSGAYRDAKLAYHAARRVGSIMGANPVPLIVPCHRVLAAGGLGGFGGGLPTKRWLLELEGVLPPTLDLGFS